MNCLVGETCLHVFHCVQTRAVYSVLWGKLT